MELLIKVTTDNESLSFMDGYLRYNQIKMITMMKKLPHSGRWREYYVISHAIWLEKYRHMPAGYNDNL